MMIAIIDYGMGNLRSVQKAFERLGAEAVMVTTPAELAAAGKIVLPGVAAFGDAMAQLDRQGLIEPLVKAIKDGTPYLGICLGLQLLLDVSYENGRHLGLGIVPGKVVRFEFDAGNDSGQLSVPHMGWNQIHHRRRCPLLEGIDDGAYMYFAHSYHVVPAEDEIIAATTDYGYDFASAIWRDNVFAVQFHPEKSQRIGLRLLENFVNL